MFNNRWVSSIELSLADVLAPPFPILVDRPGVFKGDGWFELKEVEADPTLVVLGRITRTPKCITFYYYHFFSCELTL